MDIVIVAQYLSDLEHLEETNGRFIYLAQLLKENPDNCVEIVTTSFLHWNKKQAGIIPKEFQGCKITVIHESGYPKNVCLKRFVSHRGLAKNIRTYLNSRKVPDVIYAAVPSLAVANVASQYCRKNNVRFIIDIQDLWPEAFKMVFDVPIISDFIFMPMAAQANSIYRQADELVAVSQTYLERALSVNKKCKKGVSVFLGTKLSDFDRYAVQKTKICKDKTGEVWIAYCGSLSVSYDLTCIIDALRVLKNRGYNNIRFIVMGDGPRKEEFVKYAKAKQIACEFMGMLSYPVMVKYLSACDIAVNPIKKGSSGSIINKVGDYAMAGLPVINTQESQEYRWLLNKYKAGINCNDVNDTVDAMKMLIEDENLRKNMGINSRKLGEEKFNRENTYKKIEKLINS